MLQRYLNTRIALIALTAALSVLTAQATITIATKVAESATTNGFAWSG